MIITQENDLSKIDKIEPNFTQRRPDFESPEKVKLLKIFDGEKTYFVPVLIDDKRVELSVELAELPNNVFCELVEWVFKNYKDVKKVNFLESLNNYYKNSFSYKATAYKTVLPKNKEEYLKSLAGRIRYNYVSKKRHFEKAYKNIEFKKYDTLKEDLIQRYFELKKITHDKNYELSASEYVQNYHITEAYEVCTDGETAAIVLLSGINENLYVENVTYNRKFSKYSPGIMLIIDMILDVIENSDYKNIYWGAYNDYKKHLSNKTYDVYYGVVYRSVLHYYYKRIARFIFNIVRENGRKVFIFCGIRLNP